MSLSPGDHSPDSMFNPRLISPETLEKAFTQALRDFFPTLKRNPDPRAEFYACYQRVSEEYDREFIKKYDEDLNTTLIFAGLFSGVVAAFILDVQANLQEDFTQTSAALLRVLIQKIDNSTAPVALPEWTGPPSVMVHVQCVLYSSLAAALLAAFVAMLGKQWLNRYEQVGNKGSLIERSRDRQIKADGFASWYFHLVMESLPLMLQGAVLLLGYGLSHYLWTINTTVATVIIVISAISVLFYSFIVISGIIYYTCPFQTPLSLVLRFLIYKKRKWELYHSISSHFFSTFHSLLKNVRRRSSWDPTTLQRDAESSPPGIVPVVAEDDDEVEPLFEEQSIDPDRSADVRCASWLLKTSTDADVTLATVRFVPEVERNPGSKAAPSLARLYDALSACFDSTDDFLTPEMKHKAYAAAKVFIEVYTQRRCVDKRDVVSRELSLKVGTIPPCPPDDADLYSMLEMVREIVHEEENWSYSHIHSGISLSHLSWIAHILVLRVWEFRRSSVEFPDGIYEFMRRALYTPTNDDSHSPEPLIADCLMTVGLTIGLPVAADDLLVADKSEKLDLIIDRLYEQLIKSFEKSPSEEETGRLLAALRMMSIDVMANRLAGWSRKTAPNEPVASGRMIHPQERLFCSIMNPSRRDPWPAARLALQLAFRNRTFCPSFTDSTALARFLEHHFYLEGTGARHFEPIADVFEAFSSPFLSLPPSFDISQSIVLDSIQKSLKHNKPIRVRLSALFFVEWIARHNLDGLGTAMILPQRSDFCFDLASVGNDLRMDPRFVSCYLEILLRMANSNIWRPHLLSEQWQSLEHLSTKYTDSESLYRCLLNETLIPSLSQMGGGIMKSWLKVVWQQAFETLPPNSISQIRVATLELFLQDGETVMEEFKALIDLDQQRLGTLRYVASDALAAASARQRGSIFQELCDEAHHIFDGEDAPPSPV